MQNPFDNAFNTQANNQPQVEIPPPPDASFSQVGAAPSPNVPDINPFGGSPLQPTIQPTQPVQQPIAQQPSQIANPFESNTPQQAPINNMAYNPQQQAVPFGNPPNNYQQPQNNYQNNNQQKKVYNIIDLYWLLNINPNRTQAEFEALTIGYNLDYDNIRLTFFAAGTSQVTDTQIHLSYQNRSGAANIYPEVAQELLYKLKHPSDQPQTVNLIERSLSQNSSWKPSKSVITIYNATAVGLFTMVNNQPVMFPLLQWQINCLISSLEFALTQAPSCRLMKPTAGQPQ